MRSYEIKTYTVNLECEKNFVAIWIFQHFKKSLEMAKILSNYRSSLSVKPIALYLDANNKSLVAYDLNKLCVMTCLRGKY